MSRSSSRAVYSKLPAGILARARRRRAGPRFSASTAAQVMSLRSSVVTLSKAALSFFIRVIRWWRVFDIALFSRGQKGKLVEATFNGPPRETISTTRVLHVYPSTDVLPSNTLKLYIYFSAPMSRGEAWQRIQLLDENGQPLKFEFVEIQQELWDPQNTRLTVLFDPGRIKRGVLPEMQLGPPIAEGKHYTLVIDREWKDARGVPLQQGFRKSFRGGPADRTPPDPQTWRVSAPKASTSEALVVSFPKPMDYALLQRLFRVSDAHGNVAGTVGIAQQETEWRFTPREPWKAGPYEVVFDTAIEDLSGNHIGQAFDLDKFHQVTKTIETMEMSLPVDVH